MRVTRRKLVAIAATMAGTAGCFGVPGDDADGVDGNDDGGSGGGNDDDPADSDGGDRADDGGEAAGGGDDSEGGEPDSGDGSADSDEGGDAAAWLSEPLEDVLTGDSFTIWGSDEPVLVHNFAVWCSLCDRQEERIDDLRGTFDGFTMVSLNVDPNEDADRVRDHAESNGYDWRWAIAPPSVIDSLDDEFGASVLSPPNVPLVLVCPSGNYEQFDGILSPEELRERIESGC